MRDNRERPLLQCGDIVLSLAGRDRGRTFLVVSVCDTEYVCIADGDTRKFARAKKKKNLHLKKLSHIQDTDLLENKDGTADSKIRKILRQKEV